MQTKVEELLENNKKEKDKEKREALEEKKEREKSWVDDKKEIIACAIKAVQKPIVCTKTQQREAKAKLNQFFPHD